MISKEVIKSQYRASLNMLRDAIAKCPDALWDDASYKNRFWHIAYHALFYTHLYVHESGATFAPWHNHRDQYEFLGALPWSPHEEPNIGEAYTKEEVLTYLDMCRDEVEQKVSSLNLEADSGFDWLPLNKLELQFYNIRHLQHHVGQLGERLRTQAGIGIGWVAKDGKQ